MVRDGTSVIINKEETMVCPGTANMVASKEKKIINVGDIKNSLPSKKSERYLSEDYDREHTRAI